MLDSVIMRPFAMGALHGRRCPIGHNCWVGRYSTIDSLGDECILGNKVSVSAHSQFQSCVQSLGSREPSGKQLMNESGKEAPPDLIPFNRPALVGKELEYVRESIVGGHASGNGPFTRKCESLLEQRLGLPRALLTTSCTHALELAAMLLDIGPKDEVIVPSFTFVSTASAFALRGARLVFADCRPDTMNLAESKLPDLMTSRTRAVVPVHYAGVGCDMDRIMALARTACAHVVEDNAQGLFGRYRGAFLGTIGQLAAVSFHETKNISCGEGGALFISDPGLIERAEVIREKGTNRKQFLSGAVDKYTWVDIGSSYVMSDTLAAILYAQLEKAESILRRRRTLWHRYHQLLAGWCEANDVRQPFVPAECEQSYHMYYLIFRAQDARDAAIERLRRGGVHAVFHYTPLHASPMGIRYGAGISNCPVAEDVSRRLLRLPFFTDLSTAQQNRVVRVLTNEAVLPADS